MRFNIKNTLASIALASAVGLSGCGYNISQDNVDTMVEKITSQSIEVSDRYIEVGKLLKNREYEKAKKALDEYLKQEVVELSKARGALDVTDKISRDISERLTKKIDAQTEKINAYLK